MQTKFGSFVPVANPNGTKYTFNVKAIGTDGKIVRIMITSEEANLLRQEKQGTIEYAEDFATQDYTHPTTGKKTHAGDSVGYRLVSFDNERAFTLECLGLQAKAAKYSAAPISELV